MIVKILSSARNFEGIDYSERKNDQGKSRLLKAKNFDGLRHHFNDIKKADYINYMKMVCNSNPRVKKKQFHAVISAKGQSNSPEQLLKIAEQYLSKMGYGENPYIIYYHSDTAHNHVHMVSTRVNKEGNRINDSYEKIRSQKVLNQILGRDAAQEVNIVLQNAFGYNFSTMAQFRLLLELNGIKVTVGECQLNLIKYGIVQSSIADTAVSQKIEDYRVPLDRVKQLKAIFAKYKDGRNLDTFEKLLHQKFGIQIVLHQKNGKERPYGYTIIDHAAKEVIKGSEILKLKKLLMPGSPEEKLKLLKDYCTHADFDQVSFNRFRYDVSCLGFYLDTNGNITDENGNLTKEKIDRYHLEKMKYKSLVQYANSFTINSDLEKSALAAIFNIREKDLSNSKKSPGDLISYYRKIFTVLDHTSDPVDLLRKNMIKIYKHDNNFFLLDSRHKIISEYNQIGRINNPSPLWVIGYDDNITNEPNKETKLLQSGADLLQLIIPGQDLNQEDKRPKRKRRNLL